MIVFKVQQKCYSEKLSSILFLIYKPKYLPEIYFQSSSFADLRFKRQNKDRYKWNRRYKYSKNSLGISTKDSIMKNPELHKPLTQWVFEIEQAMCK